MSGAHLHIGAGGEHAGLHGTHIHDADSHGHDHGGERDIPVLEKLVMTWAKLLPFVLLCVVLLVAGGRIHQRFLPIPQHIGKLRRRIHWRPLLRAPPVTPDYNVIF